VLGQLEAAEETFRSALDVAVDIDRTVGLSPEQGRARLGDYIEGMRGALEEFAQAQVGGVEGRFGQPAQQILAGLDSADRMLAEGDKDGAQAAFDDARMRLGQLTEVVSAARALFSAGAPPAIADSMDSAAAFFMEGDAMRGRLLLDAADVFLRNRDFLMSSVGGEYLSSLSGFAGMLADPRGEVEPRAGAAALSDFEAGVRSDWEGITGIIEGCAALAESGPGRASEEGSARWLAGKAMDALRDGDIGVAALAYSLARIEADAKGLDRRKGAEDYVGNYADALRAVKEGAAGAGLETGLGGGQGGLAELAMDLRGAALRIEAEKLAQGYSTGEGASASEGERRERVSGVADIVAMRVSEGDLDGAERLLYMATQYAGALDSTPHAWRTGLEHSLEMENAIDAEMAMGADSSTKFGEALLLQNALTQASVMRASLAGAGWGEATPHEAEVVFGALHSVEGLAAEGRAEEVAALLALTALYMNAVGGIAQRDADGKITGLDARLDASGMEDALLGYAEPGADLDSLSSIFMQGYSSSERLAVEMQAEGLHALTEGRSLGRDAVRKALEVAEQRAANGDLAGARLLMGYVEDYYGAAGQVETGRMLENGNPEMETVEAGWRYSLFSGDNASVPGYASGMQDMLDAMRWETAISEGRREDSPESQREAAGLFQRGMQRVADTGHLMAAFAGYKDLYFSEQPDTANVEFHTGTDARLMREAEGIPSVAVEAPVAAVEVSAAGPSIRYADVRAYDLAHHEEDEALMGSPTLEQLLANCETAALSGSVDAYNSAKDALEGQFKVVAERLVRARNIENSIAQLNLAGEGLSGIIHSYYGVLEGSELTDAEKESVRRSAQQRAMALDGRRGELSLRLGGMLYSKDEYLDASSATLADYAQFLKDFKVEADNASAMMVGASFITGQMQELENYAKTLTPTGAPPQAREALSQSREYLEDALKALVQGNIPLAVRAYGTSVGYRILAMEGYMLGGSGEVSASARERGFTQGDWGEFSDYFKLQKEAFTLALASPSAEQVGEVGWRQKAAGLVELAVFGIPLHELSQSLADFNSSQREVLHLVSELAKPENSLFVGQNLSDAERIVEGMQGRVEDNRFWFHAGITAGGTVVGFIPVVGPTLTTIIFTSTAIDAVATEYEDDGQVSASNWLNLGLMVGTGVLGAALQMLRTAQMEVMGAGALASARSIGNVAAGVNIASLGVGGYFLVDMSLVASEQFAAGNAREAVISLGMALMPAVHLGSAAGGFVAAREMRAEARAAREEVARTAVASVLELIERRRPAEISRRAATRALEEMVRPPAPREGEVMVPGREGTARAAGTERPAVEVPREEALATLGRQLADAKAAAEGRRGVSGADLAFGREMAAKLESSQDSFSGLRAGEVSGRLGIGERPYLDVEVTARDGTKYTVRVSAEGVSVLSADMRTLGELPPGMEGALAGYAEGRMGGELRELLGAAVEQMGRGNIGTASRMLQGRVGAQMDVEQMDSTLRRMGGARATTMEERAAALDSFAMLSMEDQANYISKLHGQGRNAEIAYLTEFTALNSGIGRGIESAYAEQLGRYTVKPGVLSDIYIQAGSLQQARQFLADALGIELAPYGQMLSDEYANFRTLADDGFLFGMLTSGDMLGAIREMHPDGRVVSIKFMSGAVGAYRVTVEGPDGVMHDLYAKRQNLVPDRNASIYSNMSGIPAPAVITNRMGGGALQYMQPDGTLSAYGMVESILEYHGVLPIYGRDMEVRAIGGTSVRDLEFSPEFAEMLATDPQRFWEDYGFAMAGSYFLGISDRHGRNVFMLKLELVNPSAQDLEALGYELRTGPAGERRLVQAMSFPARHLEMDAEGRITMATFANIDIDSAGSYMASRRSDGSFNFSAMNKMYGMVDIHAFFVRLTKNINMHEVSVAGAEGREPRFVTVEDVVRQAFGQNGDGPIFNGIEHWFTEFGRESEYVDALAAVYGANEGQPVGLGVPPTTMEMATFPTNGYSHRETPMNGDPVTLIEFSDGRQVMRPRYEYTASYPQEFAAAFPEGRRVYVAPVPEGFPGAVEYGVTTFAVFGSAAEIPPELAGSAVEATMRGGVIRAGVGFGEMTGQSTIECGQLPVLEFIAERGARGMEDNWNRIGDLVLRTEREERMLAESAASDGDNSALDTYSQDRYPGGRAPSSQPREPAPRSPEETTREEATRPQ
jgi:hypothetical protein